MISMPLTADKKQAWDAVHAAYKGTPLVSATPKPKPVNKLAEEAIARKEKVPPIGAVPAEEKGDDEFEDVGVWVYPDSPDSALRDAANVLKEIAPGVVKEVLKNPLGEVSPFGNVTFDGDDNVYLITEFSTEDDAVDGRITFRWHPKGKGPWNNDTATRMWGQAVLGFNQKLGSSVATWRSHARTEYGNADDDRADDMLEKRLSVLKGKGVFSLDDMRKFHDAVEKQVSAWNAMRKSGMSISQAMDKHRAAKG